MPIIETAVAKCDVCGKEEAITSHWRAVPESWIEVRRGCNDRLICPAHSIQVTHNGDTITLVSGDTE